MIPASLKWGGVSINAEKISPAMIHIGMFDGSFDCDHSGVRYSKAGIKVL